MGILERTLEYYLWELLGDHKPVHEYCIDGVGRLTSSEFLKSLLNKIVNFMYRSWSFYAKVWT